MNKSKMIVNINKIYTNMKNKFEIGGISILFFTSCFFATDLKAQTKNVGIGTSLPNSSAILDLDVSDPLFTTKLGFLAPRMSQAQRNAVIAPVEGLLIYQTDNTPGFYYYNGSLWVKVLESTSSAFLPLSGGTMTGAINMGANDLSDIGSLTVPSFNTAGIVKNNASGLFSTGSVNLANNETSGILPLAKGGTGISSVPASGQILIGNGTGYDLANIMSGTNISVVNAPGSITISASGFEQVLSFSAPLSRLGNTISMAPASGSANGYLSSADWNTFNSKLSALTAGTGINISSGQVSALNGDALWNASKIQNINVSNTLPTDNQILKYNSGSSSWMPADLTIAGTLTGTGTLDQVAVFSSANTLTSTAALSVNTGVVTADNLTVTNAFKLGSSTTAGYIMTAAADGTGTWQTAAAAPAGTDGQTLRYNGTALESNSNLYNNGTNVGIGGVAAPLSRLEIKGENALSTGSALNVTDGDVVPKSLLFVQNDGNIGVNDNSPDSKLEISGSSSSPFMISSTSNDLQNGDLVTVTVDGKTGFKNQTPLVQVDIDGALAVNPASVSSSGVDVSNRSYIQLSAVGLVTLSSGSKAGQVLVLQCTGGSPEILDTGNVNLTGDWTATSDDTLTLIWDGAKWVEIARSIN